ncbi:MAG TPA: response regulator [Acidobacteriaceae bacterium]|nr:response regulator [Acidobacteriaceae bacterium]
MVLVAEVTNGDNAVAAFEKHQPDVALIDLQMPGMNGVEAIRRIVERSPRALHGTHDLPR